MRYVLAVVLTLLCATGGRAEDMQELATVPFDKFSLGMREAAAKSLGARTDADGDLIASTLTGDQQWLIVLSSSKGKVVQFSLAARADAAHFNAAAQAVMEQGYVPAKISLEGKEVELLALGTESEADAKRRALFDEFLARAAEETGPAAAVFLRAADFDKALRLPPAEVTAHLGASPAYLIRHNSEGLTLIVCTSVASMTKAVERPQPVEASSGEAEAS